MSQDTAPPATMTDEEVVLRVRAGELHLFELLMRRHNQRIYRAARAILKEDGEAEDVMQDTYVRAYLESAIGQLPEGFRAVFVLRAIEELSGAETSASSDTGASVPVLAAGRARSGGEAPASGLQGMHPAPSVTLVSVPFAATSSRL
jgi:hypothetical protein